MHLVYNIMLFNLFWFFFPFTFLVRRSCTWTGMTIMEGSHHHSISFRSEHLNLSLTFQCAPVHYYASDNFVNFFHQQLWKRFRGNEQPPAHLGASRDYNVDMIPKVIFPSPLFYIILNWLYRTCLSSFSLLVFYWFFLFWLVYDGKWNSCSCPHSYWCYKVSVLQSCGWQLCL